jgi:hypothetical protein
MGAVQKFILSHHLTDRPILCVCLVFLVQGRRHTAKKDLLPQMRVVRFSVEITAFYVIMTVFFCQINRKHVMHASEVTLFFFVILTKIFCSAGVTPFNLMTFIEVCQSDFATFVISVHWFSSHGEVVRITMILGLCPPHYSRSFKAWVHFKPETYPFVL